MNDWEWQLLEEHTTAESVCVEGVELRKGDSVRLRPRKGGDIFDLALAGQVAVIESIEQDYEGKLHLAVVLEDDPGKDLGVMRQPGHRFFFAEDEVEPLTGPRVLVAGIGNIFEGDDAFGVEVIRQLSAQQWPAGVKVADFGIRGYDLAYALLHDYDPIILVDAAPRGGEPGSVYLIELDIAQTLAAGRMPDAHSMNPSNVLALATSMGNVRGRILLVGCEPAALGGEDGHMGLSGPVAAAIPPAAELVRKLVAEALSGKQSSKEAEKEKEKD
jgi:hydrogenase maturation protease